MQLLEQKEKAIQKALSTKLESYQGGKAEELLQKALELDVEAEVERRFEQAKFQLEESRNLDSQRSNYSHERSNRTKKSVQFAKSVASHATTKPTTVSTERERERVNTALTKLDDDSIAESIQIAESISQSMRSHSAADISKSRQSQSQQKAAPAPHQSMDKESSIASEYSDDFDASIASKDGASQSLGQSKQKLQAKAKDIEESAAYSETFEEESLGRSANFKDEGGKTATNMATVKEESVDESMPEHSKGSQSIGSEHRSSRMATPKVDKVDSSANSLPSEDFSIKSSVQSVEWKIDLTGKESHRSATPVEDAKPSARDRTEPSEIIEDEIEGSDTSSDLNTRDEMADLESCPEGVGQSASQSSPEDLNAKADAIADELFALLVEEYKDASDFDLNADHTDQPDEEDFRDKFPWTLDKKVVEPVKASPKPPGVTVGASPRAPKTIRELKDEEYKERHEGRVGELKAREAKLGAFLDFMCSRVDMRQMMAALNRPIERDPLKMLAQIVNGYDEESSIEKVNEDTLEKQSQIVLPHSFFNRVDQEFAVQQRMAFNAAAMEDSE